jgi:hypothetical protein
MAKPSESFRWADGASPVRQEPSAAKKNQGWIAGERPPVEWQNWLFYVAGLWTQFWQIMQAGDIPIADPFSEFTATNLEDALQEVMTEINALQAFPAGTRMLFFNDLPPTGWVKVTDSSLMDRLIVITTGTNGGSTAGTNDPKGSHVHDISYNLVNTNTSFQTYKNAEIEVIGNTLNILSWNKAAQSTTPPLYLDIQNLPDWFANGGNDRIFEFVSKNGVTDQTQSIQFFYATVIIGEKQ